MFNSNLMLLNEIIHLEVDFHPVVHSLFHGEILFLQGIQVTYVNQKQTLGLFTSGRRTSTDLLTNNLKKIAQINILTLCAGHMIWVLWFRRVHCKRLPSNSETATLSIYLLNPS